jgi:hypothetical protein
MSLRSIDSDLALPRGRQASSRRRRPEGIVAKSGCSPAASIYIVVRQVVGVYLVYVQCLEITA